MVKRYTLEKVSATKNYAAIVSDGAMKRCLYPGTAIVMESDYTALQAYVKELQACLNHMTNLWMKEREKANE